MLKHIVMWKLKEFAEGKTKAENALIMKESLERLVGIVPEIISLQVGINEKESDMAYDAVLISTFQDNTRTIHYGFATSSTYQQHTMNTSLTLAIVNDVFMVCLDYILKVKQG